ncbi:MAG: hypothetical protein V3T91_00795 [Candidatus Bipolaricaulota bacterium]
MTKKTLTLSCAISTLLIALVAMSASCGGISFGVPFYTVDLTETLVEIPVIVDNSLDALDLWLQDLGMPTAEIDALLSDINNSITDFISNIEEFSITSFPIATVGGSIEFGLPLLVIDGIRLSGGILNQAILFEATDLLNLDVPTSIDGEIEINGSTTQYSIVPLFSTFMLSTDVIKRLDLVIAGVSFGAGLDLIQGEIGLDSPIITSVSPDFQSVLDALHLDGLSWSAFAAHVSFGVEVGLPFLRLAGEARFMFPISQTPGSWQIKVGQWAGSVELAIRF